MKTLYTLLCWLFGLSAFSITFSGILVPMYFKEMMPEEGVFRFFIILIPVLFFSFLFRKKANQLDWENDLFHLTLRLTSKKVKEFIVLLRKKSDESKDKIKAELNE